MSVEQRILLGVAQEDSDMKEASPLTKMEEKGEVVIVNVNGGEVKENDEAKGLGSFLLGIDMNKDNGDEEQALQNTDTSGNGALNLVEEKDGSNSEVIEADGQDISEVIAGKLSWNGNNQDFAVDAGSEYSVGDFVWGKIKSHPWWPAQIYGASDASDHAMKLKQEGKLLVAYFGDGTFAWCHPSQLKPFGEKFEEMAKQSSSKNFVNAVDAAVDEIGRIVRLKMTCSCIPEEKRSVLDRPYALNGGVREKTLVPEIELHKLPVPWIHQISDLLTNLKGEAQNPGFSTLLDNVMLNSWILAFYRSKGIYHLPAYSEPRLIEGLEDKENDVQIGNLLSKGPEDEEWINSSSPKPVSMNVQKKKKKSMAEILEGEKSKQAAAPSRKFTHRARPKRRRVAKLIESSPITETVDSDIEVDDSGDDKEEDKAEESALKIENGDAEVKDSNLKGYVSRERKKSKYLSPPYTIPKSLNVPIFSSLGINVEVSPKPKLKLGMQMLKPEAFAKDVLSEIKSLKVDPCFSRKTEFFPEVEEFLHLFRSSLFSDCEQTDLDGEEVVGSYIKRKSDQIKNRDKPETVKDPVVSSKKKKSDQIKNRDESETEKDRFLSGKKRKRDQNKNRDKLETEKDPVVSSKKKKSDQIKNKDESETEKDPVLSDKKRKRDQIKNRDKLESEKDLVVSSIKRKSDRIKNKDESETEKDPVLSSIKRKRYEIKNRNKLETENEGSSDVKKENGDLGGGRLMISFGPGSSLPSKEHLISIYSKFGPLDESETKMYYNNFCGFVAFKRNSDAESALTSSKDCSPFGLSGNASFALRAPSPKKKKASSSQVIKSPEKEKPNVQENKTEFEFEFVQKKIKKMSEMLEKSPDGKLSEKMRSRLETELKGVLEKVSAS